MAVLVRIPTPLRAADQGRGRGAGRRRHRRRPDRGSSSASSRGSRSAWSTRAASCAASSTSTSTRRTSASCRAPTTALKAGRRGLHRPGHRGRPLARRGPLPRRMISKRVQGFTESVIREMTRVNNQYDGINLAQGMPNFPPPRELIEAAHRAIDGDFHQYAITWGTPSLRRAIAEKYRKFYGMDVDPDRNVTVCCGSTETMLATLLAVLNPGDEVIIFEPFYENYGPGCIIARRRARLRAAGAARLLLRPRPAAPGRSRSRTRAIVFNSPNNPSGKVFSRAELQAHRRPLPQARPARHHRRDLRAHRLRRPRPHPDRDAARHGRPHHHHLGHLEVLLGDRLAGGLRGRQSRSCRWASGGPTTSSRWARRIRSRKRR